MVAKNGRKGSGKCWNNAKAKLPFGISAANGGNPHAGLHNSLKIKKHPRRGYLKATPHNSRYASCLHHVPSYCPKILANTGSIPRDFQTI
jgi:hypothetical protein